MVVLPVAVIIVSIGVGVFALAVFELSLLLASIPAAVGQFLVHCLDCAGLVGTLELGHVV